MRNVGRLRVYLDDNQLVDAIQQVGRPLYLTTDGELLRKQFDGRELDPPPDFSSLYAHVSTDAIIKANPDCYYYDDRLGVLLLPTTCLGLGFPLVAQIQVRRADRLAGSIGATYAWNTVGNVLGSIGTSLLLLPILGLRGAFHLSLAFNLAAGLALLLDGTANPDRPIAVIPLGADAETAALRLVERLRRGGLAVDLGYRGNLKRRMSRANKINARAAVIIGDDELARNSATLRDLDSGEQTLVPLDALDDRLASIV